MEIGQYVIVSDPSGNVFAGTFQAQKGRKVTLSNVRRLWTWPEKATLFHLAHRGTTNPAKCRFSPPIAEMWMAKVIEILAVTAPAEENIKAVPVWENDLPA